MWTQMLEVGVHYLIHNARSKSTKIKECIQGKKRKAFIRNVSKRKIRSPMQLYLLM